MARLNSQLPEGRRTKPIQWWILSLSAIAVLAMAPLQDFSRREKPAADATKPEGGEGAKAIPAYPLPERLPEDPFQPDAPAGTDLDDEDANAPRRASLRDDEVDETDFEKREDSTR